MYTCIADSRQSSSLNCLNFSTLIYYGFCVDTMHHGNSMHRLSQAPDFCNLLLSAYFALSQLLDYFLTMLRLFLIFCLFCFLMKDRN